MKSFNTDHLKIIFSGLPGAGKTTQAMLLSRELNIPHFSSGDIIKQEIKAQTGFGQRILEYVKKGQIGPEEEIAEIVLKKIRPYHSFILDGFPRTLAQIRLLLVTYGDIKGILLKIPDHQVFNRVKNRLQCSHCGEVYGKPEGKSGKSHCERCDGPLKERFDNTIEAVTGAVKTFHLQTQPMIDLLKDQNRLITLDGSRGTKWQIWESIKNQLTS
jgi:adenylate kinase